MAQRGDRDPIHARRVEDRGTRRHGDVATIDCECYQFLNSHQFLKQTSPTQRRCSRCSMICSGKCFITDNTGTGAICPSPQIEALCIICESSSKSGIWSGENCPWVHTVSMSTIFCVPKRHGTHLPQLSLRKNLIAFSAMSSMHVLSAHAITALEPTIDPALANAPHSMGKSAALAGRNPEEGPLGAKASSLRPPLTPPP